MKLGDHSVIYEHGSIGEKNEYFGISNRPPHFFEKAVDNGWLKWIFCGHDHLNTLSLIYQGIRMTYGMSIDYLGYSGIAKQYIQRGATLITRKTDGNIDITMVPLTTVISTRVRGAWWKAPLNGSKRKLVIDTADAEYSVLDIEGDVGAVTGAVEGEACHAGA